MATGLGSSCWPRQGAMLGRAACRAGGRKVLQRNPVTVGRRSGFISVPFFCGSCQSCCRTSSPSKHSLLFTEWQLTAGLGLAGTSGDGLVQPPAQSKVSPSSLHGAVSSCVLNLTKHRLPEPLWAGSYWLVSFTCKTWVPFFAERPQGTFQWLLQTMPPFSSRVTADGSRGHKSLQD